MAFLLVLVVAKAPSTNYLRAQWKARSPGGLSRLWAAVLRECPERDEVHYGVQCDWCDQVPGRPQKLYFLVYLTVSWYFLVFWHILVYLRVFWSTTGCSATGAEFCCGALRGATRCCALPDCRFERTPMVMQTRQV